MYGPVSKITMARESERTRGQRMLQEIADQACDLDEHLVLMIHELWNRDQFTCTWVIVSRDPFVFSEISLKD